jgi:hypothetical protein
MARSAARPSLLIWVLVVPAAPLASEEIARCFGGGQPSVKMVDECDPLWEELERGKARYVVAYEEGVPAKWVFVVYSFD